MPDLIRHPETRVGAARRLFSAQVLGLAGSRLKAGMTEVEAERPSGKSGQQKGGPTAALFKFL
jgi:hypothetical protein